MDTSVRLDTQQISFGYNVTQEKTQKYALHCHNFYEVYLFLDGDVDYLVEGRQYRPTPGSLLLLSPNLFHGVRVNTDRPYRRFSIHFHPDILSLDRRTLLLSAFGTPDGAVQDIYFEEVERYHIPTCFEALEDCARLAQNGGMELLPICLEALLARILSMAAQTGPLRPAADGDTVSKIILYLNQHVKEHITLNQLSERFFISKHHLNKVFRQATGTTVMDYLLHKRVTVAQHLLINGMSAQEASLQAGFGEYSSFYRSYTRILGHSPLKDRGVLPSFAASAQHTVEGYPSEGIVFIDPLSQSTPERD